MSKPSPDNANLNHDSDLMLALALQESEWNEAAAKEEESEKKTVEDSEMLTLQPEDSNPFNQNIFSDQAVAKELQRREYMFAHSEEAEKEMTQSITGKAVILVQKILELVDQSLVKYPPLYIKAVSKDDMVYLAELMLKEQIVYQQSGWPRVIDLGYHYTDPGNMSSIRQSGLLTRHDLKNAAISPKRMRGSALGDGIYTANNPTSHPHYGQIGLLVGRLQGRTVLQSRHSVETTLNANTVIGGQTLSDPHGMVVLRTSAQCLPMISYDHSLLENSAALGALQEIHGSVQEILNDLCNKQLSKDVPVVLPPKEGFLTHKDPMQSRFFGRFGPPPPHALSSAFVRGSNVAPPPPNAPSPAFVGGGIMSAIPSAVKYSTLSAIDEGIAATYRRKLKRNDQMLAHKYQFESTNMTDCFKKHMLNQGVKQSIIDSVLAREISQAAPGSILHNTTPFAPTSVPMPVVPMAPQKVPQSTVPPYGIFQELEYKAPNSISDLFDIDKVLHKSSLKYDVNESCAICHGSLSNLDEIVKIRVCSHTYHRTCIVIALKSKPECPICRKSVCGAPQGKSPSGLMAVSIKKSSCAGHTNSFETVTITYKMKGGTQLQYHENPGQPHSGKHAVAFLPNIPEGKDLLKRLKYAFMHGLTFTIGTSLTTGRPNQCVWSSIHHKTSMTGGVLNHGYPDEMYFKNCNQELDTLRVPPASMLNHDGSSNH